MSQREGEIVDEDLNLFLERVLLSQTSLRLLITSHIPLLLKRSLAALDKQIHLRDGLPTSDAIQLLRDLDSIRISFVHRPIGARPTHPNREVPCEGPLRLKVSISTSGHL